MADQSSKGISPAREEDIFPSLDLEVVSQDDHQNDPNSLHWRDIISVDTHHPFYNSIVLNTQSLSPGPITEEQIDEWINYEEKIPNSENQNSLELPVQGQSIPTGDESIPGSTSQELLSREVISQYFYKPIEQAAEELKISSARLKKRCRELGFKRWPNRKLRSIQLIIDNVQVTYLFLSGKSVLNAKILINIMGQELGQTSDGVMGAGSIEAIRYLEKIQKRTEASPDLPLDPAVTRLRQDSFKAVYAKRRKLAEGTSSTPAPVVDQQHPLPEVIILTDSDADEDEGNKGFKSISEFYP